MFDVVAEALRLRRSVEVYQWNEQEHSETVIEVGGGEKSTKTHRYSKGWSSEWIDSSRFAQSEGHTNPDCMPVDATTFNAQGVHLGEFELPDTMLDQLDAFVPRPVTESEVADVLGSRAWRITHDGPIFLGVNPASPELGDTRIRFEEIPFEPVSIIARQSGATFEPFEVEGFGSMELIQAGAVGSDVMFQREHENNAVFTWLLRLEGFLMVVFGLLLMTKVVSAVASVIPVFGKLVGFGTSVMVFLVAVPLTMITIA